MPVLVEDTTLPRPGERHRLAWMALLAASWSTLPLLGWIAAQATVATLAPEVLASRYVVAGCVAAAAVLAWWSALGRWRQPIVAASAAAAVVGAAAVLGLDPAGPAASIALGAAALAVTVDALGPAIIADLMRATFSAREDARLQPWITLSTTAAPVFAGVVVAALAGSLGLAGVWALTAACALAALVAALALLAATPGRYAADGTLRPAPALGADLTRMARTPLVVHLGGYLVALWLAVYAVDAALDATFIEREWAEARIISFFAAFLAWGTLVGAGIRGLLGRTVVERSGAWIGLGLLPGMLLLSLVAVVATDGASWTLTAARMLPLAFGAATAASIRMMSGPLANEFQARAVALPRHLLAPVAVAAAGGLLLVVGVPGMPLAATAILLVLASMSSAWQAHAHWTWQLAGLLQPEASPVQRIDAGARGAVERALADEDAGRVLAGIDVIVAIDDPSAWSAALVGLLDHKAPLVRARALSLLGLIPGRAHIEHVRSRLSDPEPDVRAAAIGATFELFGSVAVPDARNLLNDPHPAVRSAVVEGLMTHGGPEGTRLAGQAVSKMVSSDEARLRAAAARVLGSFYAPPMRELLRALLNDPVPEVRSAAVQVAGASGDPALLPTLVVALQDRKTAGVAARALARFHDGVERDLGHAIDDTRRPATTRGHVARILGRLTTPLAFDVLQARLTLPDRVVRTEIHRAFARMTARPGLIADPDRVDAALDEELGEAEAWLQRWVDLGGTDTTGLLEEALRERMDQSLERVFFLLRSRWPRNAIALDRAWAAWRHRVLVPEDLSLILGMARGDVRERVLALSGRQRERLRSPEETVERLLSSTDPWVAVSAIAQIGHGRHRALRGAVDDFLVDSTDNDRYHAAVLARDLLDDAPPGVTVLNPIEKVLILKGVPLLQAVTAEQLVPIAHIARSVRFDRDAVVFQQGDVGDSVYLIVHGQAVVIAGGKEVARLGPGEVFGEMALLDAEPRSATVQAATPLSTLRIGSDEFQDLIDDHPEVLRGIVQVLTRRLRGILPR